MPRKKKQQPDPLDEIALPDGTILEIRGPGNYLIYRGSHKVDAHEELCDRITEHLLDKFEYVTVTSIGALNEGPLAKRQDFDIAMQVCGKFPEISDSGAVRKRIYPRVKRQIEAFWWAKKRSLS